MGMKVFHLISSFETGGAEISLLTLLQNKKFHNGIEHSIVTLYNRGRLKQKYAKAVGKQKICSLNLRSKLFLPIGVIKMVELIKRKKPDLIVSYMAADNIISSVAGRITKVPVLCGKRGTNRGRSFIYGLVDMLTSNLASAVLSNSKAGKHELVRYGVDNAKVFFIPNGINIKQLNMFSKGRATFNHRFRAKKGDMIIGTVSRLERGKRLDLIIKCMKDLPRNTLLLIIGGGEEFKNLKNLVKDMQLEEKVKFMGEVEWTEVPKIIKSFDIFVSASVREGMSRSLMEAMALGIAVVVRNIEENDIIVNNKNGLKFNKEEELCTLLTRLSKNPKLRKRLGKNAKKSIRAYDTDRVARLHVDLYKIIAKDNKIGEEL